MFGPRALGFRLRFFINKKNQQTPGCVANFLPTPRPLQVIVFVGGTPHMCTFHLAGAGVSSGTKIRVFQFGGF